MHLWQKYAAFFQNDYIISEQMYIICDGSIWNQTMSEASLFAYYYQLFPNLVILLHAKTDKSAFGFNTKLIIECFIRTITYKSKSFLDNQSDITFF